MAGKLIAVNSIKILDKDLATKTNILNIIEKDTTSLIHFIGHGGIGSIYSNTYLQLSNEDNLYSHDLLSKKFSGNPLIFLNCCISGTEKYVGGGKFSGFVSICLENGAASIITSSFPVIDKSAEEFSILFYKNFLSEHTIGESILNTRNAMKSQNPCNWGLYQLNGNPDLKLIL